MKNKKPVILLIFDGFGIAPDSEWNAIKRANMPNFENYWKNYPHTELDASGLAVGLPAGTQGASEPGHLTLGAGQVINHPYVQIEKAILNGSFFKNKDLLVAMQNCVDKNSSLHLMGLFSNGGVHSSLNHLYALLRMAKNNGIKNVFVHAFLDGRDVEERSALIYIREFEKESAKIGVGEIISVCGRYYAMDRDGNFDRTKIAYDLLVNGVGNKFKNVREAIGDFYKNSDRSDYYFEPALIVNENDQLNNIMDDDSVVFFNFRADRARQLTNAFCNIGFDKFVRDRLDICFVGMGKFDLDSDVLAAFPPLKINNNLASILAKHNLKQLRIAETEKYAHVTYFFNSQVEMPVVGEDRVMFDSDKVKSYDLAPKMQAEKIKNRLVEELMKGEYDFYVVNFANPDLVGHAGKMKPLIESLEYLDVCLKEIVDMVLKTDAILLFVSDHGNAEQMRYDNGDICPSHTTNKVPFIVIGNNLNFSNLKKDQGLSAVAVTILDLMDIKKPDEIKTESLIC